MKKLSAPMKNSLLFTTLTTLLVITACGSDDAWQQVDNTPEMFSFEGVWAFSPSDVWVVGSPALGQRAAAAHFDGQRWTASEVGTAYLAGIWAFAPNDIWAVGGDLVARYDGTGWKTTSLGEQGARDLQDIWGSSPTDVWAVGENGVFHWDGSIWQQQAHGEASGIWGASAENIWTVSTFDFKHYDGESWSTFELDLWGGNGDLWGFGADDVFLAADDEALAHWDGTAWEELRSDDVFGDLQTVWGSASDDMWAAGSFGEIARWDGKTLRSVRRQAMGSPYLMLFKAIHGSSATDVWAVGGMLGAEGNKGVIYHFAGD
ncbi:MAG: hypothetical protein JRH20_26480 [Deltaproteobacteria bacterium]|nr:hypothetical protein [Deltaproteobacteria bacterium]